MNTTRILNSILRFGYAHVVVETPKEELNAFVEANGLQIESTQMCTVTLVPAGQKASGADWERIRQDRHQKRQKAAERAKKKEATK